MSKTWFIIIFVAAFSLVAAYWAYGLSAFVFLPIFLLIFFVLFGIRALGDRLQAESIPGLEELDEPDFLFSKIYMAWLYANDRELWAKYNALSSYLLGAFLGSILGIAILVPSKVDFNTSFAGWALGMFITLLVAMRMAVGKPRTETEEYPMNMT